MKKTSILCILFIASTHTFAQYTKASFFTKPGRFYEGSISTLNFGKGIKPALGFLLTLGKNSSNGRTCMGSEVGIYKRTTFTLNGFDNLGNDVIVNGKSSPLVSFSYFVRINLIKNQTEETGKVIPYIKLSGLGLFQIGKEILANGNESTFEGIPKVGSFLTGGLGGIYSLNQKFGVKFEANYRYFISTSQEYVDEIAITQRSNLSFNVGIKYSFGESE